MSLSSQECWAVKKGLWKKPAAGACLVTLFFLLPLPDLTIKYGQAEESASEKQPYL